VLLVTSRRDIVEETLKRLGANVKEKIGIKGNLSTEVWESGESRPADKEEFLRFISYEVGDEVWLETFAHQMSVVCTNAYLSAYLKKCYDENYPMTQPWNMFDVIIIDEAHSLAADATYQDAPFILNEFIKECISRMGNNHGGDVCKHLILMTSTPEPFNECVGISFPEEHSKAYDLRGTCVNVMPDKVCVVDTKTAKQEVRYLLDIGERVVYFPNVTLTVDEAMNKFALTYRDEVGVSFSKEDKIKKDERCRYRNNVLN